MPREKTNHTDICTVIKQNISLTDYVRSVGITLTKHGSRDLKGLCPFHNDKNPSLIISPDKNLFNCPVCSTGGSVIDFASKIKNLSIKDTVKHLAKELPAVSKPTKTPPSGGTESTNVLSQNPSDNLVVSSERSNELLEKAVSFYEKTFNNNLKAKHYLENRGITDAGLFSKHRVGYADGSLLKALPSSGSILEELETLGILVKTKRGYIERFNNCAVFPVFDIEGNITTFYGRKCTKSNSKTDMSKHLFLPNRPTGLFNISVIKSCSEVIIVESVIDALSLEMCGMHNVVSVQGINGFREKEIKLFKDNGVRKVNIFFDGDEPGKREALRSQLMMSGEVKSRIISLPDNYDPNSYFMDFGGIEKTISLFTEKPSVTVEKEEISVLYAPSAVNSELKVQCGLRQYELIGLEKKARSLKVTIRVEKSGKIHVDTIDFYSARMRRQLAQDICNTFEELPDSINADISKLMALAEANVSKSETAKNKEPEVPLVAQAERKEAEEFGKSPDLIENILSDYEKCGLIGEETNKLLSYLAMTSRKMDEPLSVLILSSSGAGKTALQDAALKFCPPEDLVKLTNLSGKALFYKEKNSLKHKVLALEEGAGAEDASYAIRNLISADGLTTESTVRDPSNGKLTTMSNHVEGPTAVFCTTTNPDIDAETKSRFLVTGIDESHEQTRKILEFQRKRHSPEGVRDKEQTEKILRVHRNFQRLLKPCKIVNPYIDSLQYDDYRLQSRRVQPQYLSLINAVAFLRQFSSKTADTGTVEVDLKDIELANKIAVDILGKTLDELSIPSRNLLELIEELVNSRISELKKCDPDRLIRPTDITFTRRDIREFTSWTKTRLQIHLKELLEMEYVLQVSGKINTLQSYKLVYDGQGKDGNKFINGLKKPLKTVTDHGAVRV